LFALFPRAIVAYVPVEIQPVPGVFPVAGGGRRNGGYVVGDLTVGSRPRPLAGGLLERPALVRRLAGAKAPLVLLRAPAGYGKTTLLAQWARVERRPFTRIPLAEPGADPSRSLAAHLAPVLDAAGTPVVLAFDDAQALRSSGAVDVVSALVMRLCPGSTVVVASRGEAPLPVGRLRAEDSVLELGAADLALSVDEAVALLHLAGVAVGHPDLAAIVRRAEGWPVALHLAALALRDRSWDGEARAPFSGDDRLLADYVRAELLSGLDPGELELLVRTSPFERLSGELCDAVLRRRGTGLLLRDLSRNGVPLTPLDRGDHEFRLHPLVAETLRSELRRGEPHVERTVHARASVWFERAGVRDRAIDEAIAAGDTDRAAALIAALGPAVALGRHARALDGWLDRVGERELARRPAFAIAAAASRIAHGDRGDAERWTAVAERVLVRGAPDAPSPFAGAPAALRASIARHGLTRMREDAARARELTAEDSLWRPLASLLEGVALHLTGDGEAAHARLEEGARLGTAGVALARALSLAQLALLALDDGDVADAADSADRAVATLAAERLGEHPGSALAFAVASHALARSGRLEQARAAAADARRLAATLGDPPPWYEAELRISLAQAELRLSNPAAARDLLTKASRAARRMPERDVVQRWIDDAWARADTFAAGAASSAGALTMAELRVLRFLPSHLSFREIATRLHVSSNTVKTQAHAVYRKLDASSRSDAVVRARAIGLVED
jgi:LuxR family maltose regulon positive regulatory protein